MGVRLVTLIDCYPSQAMVVIPEKIRQSTGFACKPGKSKEKPSKNHSGKVVSNRAGKQEISLIRYYLKLGYDTRNYLPCQVFLI